ncbi:hypothetical protein V5O48_016051 [Marasmius crinis-equi]|uniref:Uncharacterized protein n=1 Tax=Marasmius crinis-equi TaxID=585013 RepID=A0ABR3ESY0_9AGAR
MSFVKKIPETFRHLFCTRTTRSGALFSPYVVETGVEFRSLLQSALNRQEDPFSSPLSTPPSSRSSTPEPSHSSTPEPGPSSDDPASSMTTITAPSTSGHEGLRGFKGKREEQTNGGEGRKVKQSNGKKKRKRSEEEMAKSKLRGKQHKKRRRQKKTAVLLCQDSKTLRSIAHEYGSKHYEPATKTANANEIPISALREAAASTAFIGNPKTTLPEKKEYELHELYKDGKNNFQLVKKSDSTQYVPCPKSKGIHVVIAPGPRDKKWATKMEEGAKFFKEVSPECNFQDEEGRRGKLNSINFGISIGNGQPKPMVLNNQGVKRKRVMDRVRLHPSFVSIAGHMCTTFLTWAPLLFLYYADITTGILGKYPELSLPFYNSVFAAFTVNFGPQTVCLPHCDSKNLAFGWCAITALSKFDHTKGGQLVLWDLKLIVKFPPGYTIFVPSAVVCHLNTKIQPHEERFSFTMYTSGDLFRWAEHGYQTESEYKKTKKAKADAHSNTTRWERGVDLFSTMEELQAGV